MTCSSEVRRKTTGRGVVAWLLAWTSTVSPNLSATALRLSTVENEVTKQRPFGQFLEETLQLAESDDYCYDGVARAQEEKCSSGDTSFVIKIGGGDHVDDSAGRGGHDSEVSEEMPELNSDFPCCECFQISRGPVQGASLLNEKSTSWRQNVKDRVTAITKPWVVASGAPWAVARGSSMKDACAYVSHEKQVVAYAPTPSPQQTYSVLGAVASPYPHCGQMYVGDSPSAETEIKASSARRKEHVCLPWSHAPARQRPCASFSADNSSSFRKRFRLGFPSLLRQKTVSDVNRGKPAFSVPPFLRCPRENILPPGCAMRSLFLGPELDNGYINCLMLHCIIVLRLPFPWTSSCEYAVKKRLFHLHKESHALQKVHSD